MSFVSTLTSNIQLIISVVSQAIRYYVHNNVLDWLRGAIGLGQRQILLIQNGNPDLNLPPTTIIATLGQCLHLLPADHVRCVEQIRAQQQRQR